MTPTPATGSDMLIPPPTAPGLSALLPAPLPAVLEAPVSPPRRRSGRVLTALSAALGLWLGSTAPSVSPVAPADPVPAAVVTSR